MNLIQEHIDNNYFVKITSANKINAIIVEYPANIFVDIPKETLIYSIEGNQVQIFRDKEKISDIQGIEGCMRPLVVTDIIGRCTLRLIDLSLAIPFIDDKPEFNRSIISILSPPKSKKERQTEELISAMLLDFISGKDVQVDDNMFDSFELIVSHYERVLNA